VKFIDEAVITVASGRGGSGCISFRREKFIPKGGPDGGNGGKGGDVILRSSSQKRTLYDFTHRELFKAENGAGGQGNLKTGRDGADLVIEIPSGTVVINAETGDVIHDFADSDETCLLAAGGRGGKGNAHFKTSTHQTPRFSQPGEAGLTLRIRLVLKLIADVGIIGLPNAGKSTLLTAISSAKPKIGNYPFTTLTPNLAVVYPRKGEPFIAADIPGLIEGAHHGVGLGIQFLKHIERTRVLIHMIDVSTIDSDNPLREYKTVNAELIQYNPCLREKPQIVVLNKMDQPGGETTAELFRNAIRSKSIYEISAITGQGLDRLITQVVNLLDTADDNREKNPF
jgi:GTP-binding protein